jgi:hypothetical protein
MKFVLFDICFLVVLFRRIFLPTACFADRKSGGEHNNGHADTPAQVSVGICGGMAMSLFRPTARNGIKRCPRMKSKGA